MKVYLESYVDPKTGNVLLAACAVFGDGRFGIVSGANCLEVVGTSLSMIHKGTFPVQTLNNVIEIPDDAKNFEEALLARVEACDQFPRLLAPESSTAGRPKEAPKS